MTDEDPRQAFLRGFEEGLKAAWREIASLTTRGYSSTELSVMSKSKLAVIYRDVEAMAARLETGEAGALGASMGRIEVGRRGAYLVREPKASRIFEIFEALLRAGARGLGITRTHPEDLRDRYGLDSAGFIWLSKSPGKKVKGIATVEPTALVDLASAIAEFAADGGNAAIILEGLEYMISRNTFASMMRFLQKVNEEIVLNDSYLLISANPAAMKEQEYKLLVREAVGEI